ncbi:Bax inhibitor-1 family protein [Chryseobacterium oranimense]|uniref:Bax inhibitor-1 family protein n=1 Tax=Chryseobacterium oranimense TaxID=421058 RepID=UPI0021AFD3E2|nr:Bax inhibitor-1 family protein [Chryseobacterium oranimense]UWX59121.1 Bax inhibitor-1 family protein [Chryseobacterium oranimense]
MELRIKPFPKNIYPKKGLLIKGPSPRIWLHEMEILGIDLNRVKSYAIPSDQPNVLYGCLLVFYDEAPQEIGRNAYFQCVDDQLFIPENTIFYPKINPEDWPSAGSGFMVMHPEFGFVRLTEEIDWLSLIYEPEISIGKVRKPSNGVKIPQHIESFTVEMDDEKVLETLQQSKSEEEWMNNLPFDLKKVMAGNKKEIEKYLKYLEKYPDRAVELGVPLDIMGTSRGDGFGKFTFGDNWLNSLFGGSGDKKESAGSRNFRWIFWGVVVIAIFFRIFMPSDKDKTQKEDFLFSSGNIMNGTEKLKADIIAYQSGVTDIDMKIDSIYGKERKKLSSEYVAAGAAMSKDKNERERYKKLGGRNLGEVGNDIEKLNAREQNSRDSLKIVYSKRITKHLVQQEETMKRRISDSLKQYTKGKPVNGEIVKFVLKKKQVLMADSLGKLYGTLDIAELPPAPIKDSKVGTLESGETSAKEKTRISDILYLVIFMFGAVGIYSFIFKRKSLNLGGDNVPLWVKIILSVMLVSMLVYLFYPLIKMFGYNWFVWILVIFVILLLYRLFSEDKTILNSDDDE